MNNVILNDKDFKKLSGYARSVYFVLRFTDLNNSAGIMAYDESVDVKLAVQSGWDVQTVKIALQELQGQRWVVIEDGLLWVRNQVRFDPHINLDNEKNKEGIINQLLALPSSRLIETYCAYYGLTNPYAPTQTETDTPSIPPRYPLDTPSIPPRSTERETERESKTPQTPQTGGLRLADDAVRDSRDDASGEIQPPKGDYKTNVVDDFAKGERVHGTTRSMTPVRLAESATLPKVNAVDDVSLTGRVRNTADDGLDDAGSTGRVTRDSVIPYEKILSDLNLLTNQHYRAGSRQNRKWVKARWAEGYRLDDFLKVHRHCLQAWKNKPDMWRYWRPETLYGNKFESYLNAHIPPDELQASETEVNNALVLRRMERKNGTQPRVRGDGGFAAIADSLPREIE